jgi:putative sigma-54 modulation protein
MRLQVKGKNVEVSNDVRQYAEAKLARLGRHLDDATMLELELAEERNPSISQRHVAEATVWTKGPVLRARESSGDVRASIDLLYEKLERQAKRYREKRGRRQLARQVAHRQPSGEIEPAAAEDTEEPAIVKTKQFAVKPMTPEEAVLQLELIGHDFFVFRNVESGDVGVVYRRRAGNFGLIEPRG